MNENNVNIGEILKDAPRGLKLYSPIFGEVELNCVYDTVGERNAIETFDNHRYSRLFSANGKFHNCPDGECMLFPSEKHRNWVEWQKVLFKHGDVITAKNDRDEHNTLIYDRYNENTNFFIAYNEDPDTMYLPHLSYRYATPGEKENFFNKLEKNGYIWDDKTKEIYEIESSNPEYNSTIDNILKNNTFYYPEQETEVEVTPDGCYKCVLKSTKNKDKENVEYSTSETILRIRSLEQTDFDYMAGINGVSEIYIDNENQKYIIEYNDNSKIELPTDTRGIAVYKDKATKL